MNEKEIKNEENDKEKTINNISKEKYLLPPKSENKMYLKTLILDLDETLAHGQNIPFTPTKNQIILQCKLNNIDTNIYVKIRPGVKEFLRKMNKIYEIIIFTASIEEYAKPLINLIDQKNFCSYKLYREHCVFDKNAYIKDLKKLGRDLKDVIILDNSPNSYILNKENGLPITTWFDDEDDRELYNITQILEFLSNVDDVRVFIPKFVIGDEISYFASNDLMRKFKNKNLKNNNMSAINFHPFMNDSNVNNRHLNEANSHSIIVEKINIENNEEENNEKEEYNISKFDKDTDRKEKDLIDISENLFDEEMLNENINRTDFDIRINDDINLLTNKGLKKIDDNKDNNKNKNEKKDNKKNNDTKNNNTKEKNIKDKKQKNDNINKNNENKKPNSNLSKNDSKINKNKSKNKAKVFQKNNNIRKIRHIKSSSYSINTISNFNLLMPNHKSKKEENIKNDTNSLNITIKTTKSKTLKKPIKNIHDEKTKRNLYRPRNITTEFKTLRTLNNSVNKDFNNKIQSKLNAISNSPKKTKKNVKNKNNNKKILSQISESKEKEKKIKTKSKEEFKIIEGTLKKENDNYTKTETNKKELIKHRKKTPFRVHPKKEKNINTNIINISIRKEPEKEKENKIINNKNIIKDISTEKNKKESIIISKDKNNETIMNNTLKNNNHKAAKSTKNFHINKKIENRVPWGWGGYTLKLSDLDNLFNYNVESREIRIAKLDINIFKRAKSHKFIKIDKNKTEKDSKENDTKKKRGISSSNSTNNTINKADYNKD